MKYITILVLSAVLLAGCTYTDVNSPVEYHGLAQSYSLNLPGWNITTERNATDTYDHLESSWVLIATRDTENVKVTILVFNTIEHCTEALQERREATGNISETIDYGNGYQSEKFGYSLVVDRKQNVMWEVKGSLEMNEAKELSERQEERIE